MDTSLPTDRGHRTPLLFISYSLCPNREPEVLCPYHDQRSHMPSLTVHHNSNPGLPQCVLLSRAHLHSDSDIHRGAEWRHAMVVHFHCHHQLPPFIFQGLAVQWFLAVHLACVCVDGEVVAEQSWQDPEAQLAVGGARLIIVNGLKR